MKKNKKLDKHFKELLKKSKGTVDAITDANRTKILINPEYSKMPPIYNNQVAEEGNIRMFKTLFEKQVTSANFVDLDENSRTKLELCSYEYDIPFEELEEVFLIGAQKNQDIEGGLEAVAEYIEEMFDDDDDDKLESILLNEWGFGGNKKSSLNLPSAQSLAKQSSSYKEEEPKKQYKWYRIETQTENNPLHSYSHQINASGQDEAEEIALSVHNKNFKTKNGIIVGTRFLPNGPRKTFRKVGKANPLGGDRKEVEVVTLKKNVKRKTMSKTAKRVRNIKRTIQQIKGPVSDYASLDSTGPTGGTADPTLKRRKKRKTTRKRKVAPPKNYANDNDQIPANDD